MPVTRVYVLHGKLTRRLLHYCGAQILLCIVLSDIFTWNKGLNCWTLRLGFSSLRGESPSLLVGVIVSARKKAEVKEVLGSRRTYQFTL
jgi:hypothetical protein